MNTNPFIVIILLIVSWGSIVLADYDTGFKAYLRGDFKAAYKQLEPEAQKGDSKAQFALGLLYQRGNGVKKDYVKAYMWYNLAATNGNERAIKNKTDLACKMSSEQIKKAEDLFVKHKDTKSPLDAIKLPPLVLAPLPNVEVPTIVNANILAEEELSCLEDDQLPADEAIKKFKVLVESKPESVEVLCNLADAYSRKCEELGVKKGKLEGFKAVQKANKARELDPKSVRACISLANAYYACGKKNMAVMWANKALELDTNNPEAKKLLEQLW